MGRRALVAVALGACALLPATARAGTYEVYSCNVGGSFYANNAWVADGIYRNPPFGTVDATCTQPGDRLAAALTPGQTFNLGWAGLTLRPPNGTTISDFTVQMHFRHVDDTSDMVSSNASLLFRYGDGFFSGAGNLRAGDAARLGHDGPHGESHWWGGGASPTDVTVTLSRGDSVWAQQSQQTESWGMILSSDCGDEPTCPMGAGDVELGEIVGSRVTINDPVPPSITAVAAGQGLLAPGVRAGNEPVTFSATDNTGIRRAEMVDVTDTAHPITVAAKDVPCDDTRPRPCPDIKDETIATATPIAGHRTILLRVTDAGGETTVSAPFSIYARGPVNGVNGGDGSRLVAGFPAKIYRGKGKKRHAVFVLRPRHTVSYGKTARIRGTLKGANGQPVSGADVRILVRENRLGAQYVDRGGVTTGADGRFQLTVPKGSSRFFRLAYRAYTGDDNFAARSTAALNVRARISVTGPRHVRRHGVATFRGRLVGRPFPPRGVTLELQIFQPHVGWRVFGNTRTRKNGRFRIRYRFQPTSRGRFTFRIRLRPNDAYPYTRGSSRRMRVRVG